ncbi:Plasmodium exported protein, unknown function [Plasmodium gonderi]|uniref:Variable surface protein n=1 Tax=Plasmodium gonderi TaxID=77519 RepID=A0A1Y1JWB4_PLAGO|nr:Plasmodium exported protein, unknown function [Plasmodium gonderi]GAW84633.1 Plasmodium exported protein, unknown function [Plasmodium gonderi]
MRKNSIYIKIFTLSHLTCTYPYPNETLFGKYICNIHYDNNALLIRKERLLSNNQGKESKKEKVKNYIESDPNNKKRKNESEVMPKFTQIKNCSIIDLILKTLKNKSVQRKVEPFRQKVFNYLDKYYKYQENGNTPRNTFKMTLHAMCHLSVLSFFFLMISGLSHIIFFIVLFFLRSMENKHFLLIFLAQGICFIYFTQFIIILLEFIPTFVNVSKYHRLNKGK